MALFNEILVGRFNRALQKLIGTKGGPPAPQLSSEIMPILTLFRGAEDRYLESWNRFGAASIVGPTAANQSGWRFRNPVGSNVLAVLEALVFSSSAVDTGNLAVGTATADLASVNTPSGRLDARIISSNSSSVISSQSSAVSVPLLTNPTTVFSQQILASTPVQIITFEDQELTVLPGDAYQLVLATVNEKLNVSAIWRERQLEESERA